MRDVQVEFPYNKSVTLPILTSLVLQFVIIWLFDLNKLVFFIPFFFESGYSLKYRKKVAILVLAIHLIFWKWWLYQIWLYHKKVAIHNVVILCKWLYFCFFPLKLATNFKKFSDLNYPFRTLNWKLTWRKRTKYFDHVLYLFQIYLPLMPTCVNKNTTDTIHIIWVRLKLGVYLHITWFN